LRASDQPRSFTAPLPDDYYAVDGSRMRYQRSTGTLFLQDGSRVVGGQHIDRNGNTLTAVTGGLQDTLGRVINNPLVSGVVTLPGVGNTTLNYTMVWKSLGEALTTPEPLRYKGNSACPPETGGTFSPSLFSSDTFSRTCIGNSSELFNPVVLHQIVLPNNLTYTFTYNVYGEITKMVLPTGGYERFIYAQITPTSSNLTGVYRQPSRGVTRHFVSPTGSGTDEIEWQYSNAPSGNGTVVTKIAPDGTRTESHLWGNLGSSWGYSADSARAGRPYDERTYTPTNQMIRRKLTQWALTPSNAAGNFGGTSAANRNARIVKELDFILDTGGQALAKTTTYGYDLTFQHTVGIDQTSVTEFDYFNVDQNTAQTLSINSVPTFSNGTTLRTSETDYLTSDVNYRSRNLVGLPTAMRIKNGSGTVVVQSSRSYDEGAFPLLTYASVSNWIDLATPYRGNVTSMSRWLNFNGTSFVSFPSGFYLVTHTQYDHCGSPRKVYDAKDIQLLNPTLIDYSATFHRAYPTTNTSPDPDLTPSTNGPLTPLTTTTEYDLNTGLVTATVDPNLQRTEFDYTDPLNRKKQVIRAATDTSAKTQITYTYDDVARTVTTTADLNVYNDNLLKMVAVYDNLGRLRETQQFESANNFITTIQEFDNMGRILRKSNPHRPQSESPVWTTLVYDSLERITSITSPDNTVVTTAYSGAHTLVTDPSSRQRVSRSDALGRLSEVWEIRAADGATESISFPGSPGVTAGYLTKYSYDMLDNLTSVTQRIGAGGTTQTRTYTYDSADRLVFAVNPENGTESYQHDNNGSIISRTDSRSTPVTTTYTYDALKRVTTRSYSDGTPTVTYAYDLPLTVPNAKSRLTSVSSSVSTYSYMEYDALGRVRSGKQTTDGLDYSIEYTYDLAGSLKTEKYPGGRIVAMDYDVAGRLAGVQNQGGSFYAGAAATDVTNRIQYTANGFVSKMKLGNNLWEHANFNLRFQPTQIGLGTTAANSSVMQLDYNWGTTANNGNLIGQTLTIPGLTLTQAYTYDSLNRLETATENGGSSWKLKFGYDRYGNRSVDTNPTFTSPDLIGPNPVISPTTNRIVAQAGEQYIIDGAGNLTRGREGQTYAFDGENRMITFNGGPSQGGASYSYDGDGRRIKKVTGSVTTTFVYDVQGRMLAEYSSASPAGTGTSYMSADHLGTPRVITDATGAVKARHDYLPFGEEIGLKGGRNTDPHKYVADNVRQKFTGKERDNETTFDYFGARYYSSAHGRFTSPDPLSSWMLDEKKQPVYMSNPQRWNKYIYVLNNPLRYVDPDGLADVPSWNQLDVRVREDLAKRLGPEAEKIWNGWSSDQRQHVLNVRAVLMDKGVWQNVTKITYGRTTVTDNWGPRNTVTFTEDNSQTSWQLGIQTNGNTEHILRQAGFIGRTAMFNHPEGRYTMQQPGNEIVLHMVLLDKPADAYTVPHFDAGGGEITDPDHFSEWWNGTGQPLDTVTKYLGTTSAGQYLRNISESMDKLLPPQPKKK
jgi:RHS repeat-associated protein